MTPTPVVALRLLVVPPGMPPILAAMDRSAVTDLGSANEYTVLRRVGPALYIRAR